MFRVNVAPTRRELALPLSCTRVQVIEGGEQWSLLPAETHLRGLGNPSAFCRMKG
jgi:hypothetical protein